MCTQITDEPIHSPAFSLDSLGVTKFILYLYPRGRLKDKEKCISIYLSRYNFESEVIEGNDLSIDLKVFADDECENLICKTSKIHKLNKNTSWKITSIDRSKIFKKSDIFSNVHLSLILNANIVKQENMNDELWTCKAKDLEVLSTDISRALESPMHSDFLLKGNNDIHFPVHKAVLIFRYPKLSSVLGLHDANTKEKHIRRNEQTLKYLLQYIYSGKIDVGNISREMHDILHEHELLHMQCLLFPPSICTTVETRIRFIKSSMTWTIPSIIDIPKTLISSRFLSHDCRLKWSKIKITCYFRLNEKNEDCIIFSINRIFSDCPLYLACKIQIVGSTDYVREYDHLFLKDSEWTLPPYVTMTFLNENQATILPLGMLRMKFLVHMSDGTNVAEITSVQTPNIVIGQSNSSPASNLWALHKDLKKLHQNSILSDVKLQVGEKTFDAHNVILSSRSVVFSKMFEHKTLEKKSGEIVINDFKPKVVQTMLSYMYCGEVDVEPHDFDFIMDLYAISDKYQILELKAKCVAYFKTSVDERNVGKLLVLADTHYDNHLKKYVTDFVCSNASKVLMSKEWNEIMCERQDLASYMLNSVLSFIAG